MLFRETVQSRDIYIYILYVYIYIHVYIYISNLHATRPTLDTSLPTILSVVFFTHACQDMTYVRKHQLRRSKLLWNLQVEILLLTWPRSPLPPRAMHGWQRTEPGLTLGIFEGFESVHHKSIRNSSSRYPTPKEIPFQNHHWWHLAEIFRM